MIGINKSQVEEVERDQDSRTKNNTSEKLGKTKSKFSYQSYNIYFWIAVSSVILLVAILTRYRERIDSPQIEDYKHRAKHISSK
jgi:hypothetical protein